ncbi:MAG: hypothetical protein WDN04_09465 [Rhodospirillales bacterium]
MIIRTASRDVVSPTTLPMTVSVPVSLTATLPAPLTVPVTARSGVSFSAKPAAEKSPTFAIVLLPVSAAVPALVPVRSAVTMLPGSPMPPAPAVRISFCGAVTVPFRLMPAPVSDVVPPVMLPSSVRVPVSTMLTVAPPLTAPVTSRSACRSG